MPLGSHVSQLSAEDRARLVQHRPPDHPDGPSARQAEQAAAPEAEPAPRASSSTNPHSASSAAPVWLQRLSLVMLVLFCVYLGILVAILPWWTRIWDQNLFINSHPALAAVLHTGAVRGLISGLGLVDIWIGISEAIHYRDHRP